MASGDVGRYERGSHDQIDPLILTLLDELRDVGFFEQSMNYEKMAVAKHFLHRTKTKAGKMTAERQELLECIGELSECYPSMRLGQLISNLAQFKLGDRVSANWDITDQELLAVGREWLASRDDDRANAE